MSLEEYREASRGQWRYVAGAWEAEADTLEAELGEVTARMLTRAGVRPGTRVLELACGPAGVGLRAAAAVGPDGEVICSDFAAEMVAAAERRAAAAGLDNVTCRVLDAEALDLADASVDAVLCRFGFMLFPDPAAAAREARRVLRPGGRLALAVWARKEENPWIAGMVDAVVEHLGVPPPPAGSPGIFRFAEEAALRALLEDTGFADAAIEGVEGCQRAESFDVYWARQSALAGPVAQLLAEMPEERRAAIRDRVRASLAPWTEPGGALALPARALVASGTRP